MNILIMGPAGSGKGTIAERIIEDYKVMHLSTGQILRDAIKNELPYGLIAKDYMDKGKLVPDDIVNKIVADALSQIDKNVGFLTDGYPRTLSQAIEFDKLVNSINREIDVVISLEIEFDQLITRITGRRLCKKCGKIYHVEANPPKVSGVCDTCNIDLIQRADDTKEQLEVRLEEHRSNTEPVLEHYKKQNKLEVVNAMGNRDQVYEQVINILEKYK